MAGKLPRGSRTRHPLSLFERFAAATTRAAGRSGAFGLACLIVLAWAVTGPFFHFSETWQIVINTATTIVTFLMVFLIQQSQNKDSLAIHLKLNELLASHPAASNRVVSIEDLSDEELEQLHRYYSKLARLAQAEDGVHRTHSLDEAERTHRRKHTHRQRRSAA